MTKPWWQKKTLTAVCVLVAFIVIARLLMTSGPQTEQPQPERVIQRKLVIGAADTNDAFYSAAIALSTFFKTHTDYIDIDLSVQVTPGSVYNTQSVIAGDLDIALVQSAVQAAAVHGRGEWEAIPQKSLRSICSLFTGALMLIVPDDSPIRKLEDLAGKRVGVNIPGSGTNMNTDDLLDFDDHKEWAQSVERVRESTSNAIAMMAAGELDAVFINSGHPAEAVIRLIRESRQPLRFVPIDNVQSFLRQYPSYIPHYIPLKTYPGIANTAEVKTIGTPTTMVTTDAMPEEEGIRIAKTLYEGFDDLRALHPTFADINRSNIQAGLEAPLHKGCAQYFRAVGPMGNPGAVPIEDVTLLLASAPAATGYYNHTANLANFINDKYRDYGVRIFVSSTNGSVDNINMLISGEASFGISAGQPLYDAVRARGSWSKSVPQRKLRSLARIGSDSYFLVVADDAFADGRLIPGARISVGLPGSGEETMSQFILSGVPGADKAQRFPIDVIEGRKMMAARQLDATLFTVFHDSDTPPASIGRQLSESLRFSERPLRLIPLNLPKHGDDATTYYQTLVVIPPTVPGDSEITLMTLTTPVIFFTSVDVPNKVVETVCTELLESALTTEIPDWRFSFSGLPIVMHDSMVEKIRERTGVVMDPGPDPYEKYLTIGSGSPDSDFAQVAGALSALLNQERKYGSPLIVVKPANNGSENINLLPPSGGFELCLSESFNSIDAFNGRGEWNGRPQSQLRKLATAYVSSFTVLVKDGDQVQIRGRTSASEPGRLRDIAELEGQRVSLPAGKDMERDNAVSIFSYSRVAEGLRSHSFLSANEPGGFEPGMKLLQQDAILALMFASGSHPNRDIKRFLGNIPLRPLSVTGIHDLLVSDRGYSTTTIPAGAYAVGDAVAGAADIPTLGIPVDLLTTVSLSNDDAFRIALSLANRIDGAGKSNPVFANMNREMLAVDNSIPLHEGARRAYLRAGLLTDEEGTRMQNVAIMAIDPYCNGLEMAVDLARRIPRLYQTFRAHADVANGIDVSLQFLLDGYVEFGIFPSVLLFDPAVAEKLETLRSVAWFGREQFVCITGANSPIESFADLTGKTLGLPDGYSLEEASFDALCRILETKQQPKKMDINQHNFLTRLFDGSIDAAILTVGRLERWLDEANMTLMSKHIKYVDFRRGFFDDAGDRLAAMASGLGEYEFTIQNDTPFAVPSYWVSNVMLTGKDLPDRHAQRMAWTLDPDNPKRQDFTITTPVETSAPGMRASLWRYLPLPLHEGVEHFLREKEDGRIPLQDLDGRFR
jgi:TRAP transporter TAXI family solute receptor